MRDKGYRLHQYYKHKEEQRKLMERYEPHASTATSYRVRGQNVRGEEGYNTFIENQAAKRSRTPKPCSCYLCSVSTKRDGYSISDRRRLAHGIDLEDN